MTIVRRRRNGSGAVLASLIVVSVASAEPDALGAKLASAAIERTRHSVRYDGAYRSIPYPGGDVPDSVGVCTDVVVRAYRQVGIDLQVAVNEEMSRHFDAYPKIWGLHRADPNIDHRRVENLRVFLARRGRSLPVSSDPAGFREGDLVTWQVGGTLPHIGIVVGTRSSDGVRPLVVHNIGSGPRLEDVLFAYPMTGHYRYPAVP